MITKRVLPADVYDTLELSAYVYGGIGALEWFEDIEETIPVCISGHATTVCNGQWDNPVRMALTDADILLYTNDNAVPAINKRRGRESTSRVTWEEYCAELDIVRGD